MTDEQKAAIARGAEAVHLDATVLAAGLMRDHHITFDAMMDRVGVFSSDLAESMTTDHPYSLDHLARLAAACGQKLVLSLRPLAPLGREPEETANVSVDVDDYGNDRVTFSDKYGDTLEVTNSSDSDVLYLEFQDSTSEGQQDSTSEGQMAFSRETAGWIGACLSHFHRTGKLETCAPWGHTGEMA